ncbi:MAG TPA: hypothetical protein VMQ48_00795 [Candidatus Saccharimonadales bacterium]|nr:hypothetical protein [Candidatus Saccharimonadales bacterium]
MASQIAHVIYAQKYLEKNPRKGGEFFILGTLFPDMRRVAKGMARKDTHMRFEKIDLDFEGMDLFDAGWKFHLWCDMRREEILNKYNFYTLRGAKAIDPTAKLVEDELVYDKYKNWEKLIFILNNPPIVKTSLDVSQETIEHWYAILAKYFQKKPDDKTMKIFLSKQSSLKGEIAEIIDGVRKLRENQKATDILKKVCEEII